MDPPTPVTSDDDPHIDRPAPLLGQHSIEVLRELGVSETEIESLVGAGIVVCPALSAAR